MQPQTGQTIQPKPKQPANDYQVGGDHYQKLKIQPWDAMRAWFSADEWRGYIKGAVISYLARERSKGGDLDIQKATHCLTKLMETIE